jgi:ATP/maltotriose-dependent transcriptional regulator MalT
VTTPASPAASGTGGQPPVARGIDPGYLAAGLIEPLTDRELEVLRLLAAARSNQRIAHDLVVALDTVKST